MNYLIKKNILATALVLFSSVTMAEQVNYQIDDSHSFANFVIPHGVGKVSGSFSDVKGKIILDTNKLENSTVEAKINMLSIHTGHAKRDENLRKPKYLDLGKLSEITFVSKKIEAKSNTEGVMIGTLTMHGVSKEMAIPFKFLGAGPDPFANYKSAFEAHTTLKASDFGFEWTKDPESGIGNDLEITLLIEAVKSAPPIK